jgi:DNA-binding transcriptional MerR regulator
MNNITRQDLWQRLVGPESSIASGIEPRRPLSATAAAEAVGLTLRAVRHYEAEGLLPQGRRGKRRSFLAADLDRLRLIRNLRRIGMPLPAIRDILADLDAGAPDAALRPDVFRAAFRVRRRELHDTIVASRQALADLTTLEDRLLGSAVDDEVVFADDAADDRQAAASAA